MTAQDLLAYSHDFACTLWQAPAQSSLPYLADDFTFIGPFDIPDEDRPRGGHRQLVDFCVKLRPLTATLTPECDHCSLIYGDAHTNIVAGAARLVRQAGGSVGVNLTMVWRMTAKGARLAHLHISVPLLVETHAAIDEADLFERPGAEELAGASDSPVVLRDTEEDTHVLEPRAIVSLEAQHQYTVVHLQNGSFRVRGSLTSILESLPPSFVRVHRSHAVNALLVEDIRRGEIAMAGGMKVPVPAKQTSERRRQIVAAIEAANDPTPGEHPLPVNISCTYKRTD